MTKTNSGGFDIHHAFHHRKPVKPRHLDVEEDKVGLFGLDLADRLASVGAGVDDLDVLKGFEPQLQALNGEFLVVDEDGSDGHADVPKVRWAGGGRGMTFAPAGAASPSGGRRRSRGQGCLKFGFAYPVIWDFDQHGETPARFGAGFEQMRIAVSLHQPVADIGKADTGGNRATGRVPGAHFGARGGRIEPVEQQWLVQPPARYPRPSSRSRSPITAGGERDARAFFLRADSIFDRVLDQRLQAASRGVARPMQRRRSRNGCAAVPRTAFRSISR